MKKLLLTALLAVTMMGGLTGCPPKDAVLDVYGWVYNPDGSSADGKWKPVDDNSDLLVPAGGEVVLNFSSAQTDVKFLSGTIKVDSGGKTDTSSLVADPAKAKRFKKTWEGQTDPAYMAAAIMATLLVVDMADNDGNSDGNDDNGENRKGFEITVPMPIGVDRVDVRVKTNIGDWLATLKNASAISAEGEGEGAKSYVLTVTVQGEGSVKVDGVASEVTSTATFDVDAGVDVFLKATPASESDFVKWTVNGQDGITNTQAKVTMDSDVDVVAIFAKDSTSADTTPPVITLSGANPVNLAVGATWSDPGATASDAVDGTRSVAVSGTINTAVAGTYTLTYTASDASGNMATATRTVIVGDVTPPPAGVAVAFTSSGNNLSATVNTEWLTTVSAKPSGITNVRLVIYYPTENGYPSAPWEAVVDVATNGNTTVNIPSTAIRTNTSGQAIARMAMEVRNGTTATWVDIGRTISTFNGATTPINNGAWQKTL